MIGRQRGRRRQDAIGLEHAVHVVVERAHEPVAIHGVEPLRLAVEEEQDHVGERAGPQAAADGEVHDVAEPSALPLAVEDLGGNGREAVLHPAAAAPARAHEELPAKTRDVDEAGIGPDDEVAATLVHPVSRAAE